MKTKQLINQSILLDKCPKPIINTPDDELELHTVVCAVGKRRSGKSVAISSKLRHLQEKGFMQRLFIISPTAKSPLNLPLYRDMVKDEDIYEDPSGASVKRLEAELRKEWQEWCTYKRDLELWEACQHAIATKSLDNMSEEMLIQAADRMVWEDKPEYKYKDLNGESLKHPGIMHAYFDDCQSSALFRPSSPLMQLIISHRHRESIGVSCYIAVQSFTAHAGLPKALREQCCQWMLYRYADIDRRKQICKTLADECSTDELMNLLDYATKDSPHDFLCVDLNHQMEDTKYRRNWDTVLMPQFIPRVDANDLPSDGEDDPEDLAPEPVNKKLNK